MRITKIVIENVKSFENRREVLLNPTFNILVGPNAGGKSNLLDIITVTLRHFLMQSYIVSEGSDTSGRFRDLHVREAFGDVARVLDKHVGRADRDSLIEITVEATVGDCRNVSEILAHRDGLSQALHRYRNKPYPDLSFLDDWDVALLNAGQAFRFTVKNNRLDDLGLDEGHRLYLKYLRDLELFLILARDCPTEINLTSPYLFFSPYRGANPVDLEASLSEDKMSELMLAYHGATSSILTSLVKIATLRFASRMRRWERDAKDVGYRQRWLADREVQDVQRYLDRLGYKWDLELIDEDKNVYRIRLEREGRQFNVAQASSGEREILNFVLGIFAFGLSEGVVLIDEPELHLHPRWQRVLRDLLVELAQRTGNQVLVTTHSPAFVSPETVQYVHRVFRSGGSGTEVQTLRGTDADEAAGLVHVINSHNNEKLFFADRVILVEGIIDRLVIERLVAHYREAVGLQEVVEVLEVHGKDNFEKYYAFLTLLRVPTAIIADQDYALTIGDARIRALFETDWKNIDKKVLKGKKSKDRVALSKALDTAIATNDLDGLQEMWCYIKGRITRIKAKLSGPERQLLETFLNDKVQDGVHILRRGEIEDYLPTDVRSVSQVVAYVDRLDFVEWFCRGHGGAAGVELADKVLDVMDVDASKREMVGPRRGLIQRLWVWLDRLRASRTEGS